MEHISDLFGRKRTITPKGAMNERAELIKYFSEEMNREPKVVGIRLGHYKLDQLYALQSAFKDRLKRNGRETAMKYVWAITRTTKV